jgi:hypothetical protein
MQDAKGLPELVAQIHRDPHHDNRSDPSAGSAESWRAPHQDKAQRTQRRDGQHHHPHWPIVPWQEAALAVAAVAAVAVSRIQRMRAAPAMLGVAHEAYPMVRSQTYPFVMPSMGEPRA